MPHPATSGLQPPAPTGFGQVPHADLDGNLSDFERTRLGSAHGGEQHVWHNTASVMESSRVSGETSHPRIPTTSSAHRQVPVPAAFRAEPRSHASAAPDVALQHLDAAVRFWSSVVAHIDRDLLATSDWGVVTVLCDAKVAADQSLQRAITELAAHVATTRQTGAFNGRAR